MTCLLFDLDGTLTDPFEGITRSIVHGLTSLGRPAPDPRSLGWCIGPSLRTSFARLLDTSDSELIETALARYRERFGTRGLFENQVYPDIPRVLEQLQDSGHTLFVATAKPTVYAEQIMRHFGLEAYFEKVYGSELNGRHSDKADLIGHILTTEAIAAAEAIMIGDHAQDMIGAARNQVPGIGVLWGYGRKDDLIEAGARCTITEPLGLQRAVKKITEIGDATC